jgi:biopolymer transport protein ExbB
MRFAGKIVLLALVMVMVFMAGDALAQHGGDAAHQGKSLWELFKSTGAVGILIVILSVAGTAISIQYGLEMREDQLAPPHLVAEVEELIGQGEIEQAQQVASADPSYFGRVMGSALGQAGNGVENAIHQMEVVAMEETFKLNAKISYVSLVGNLGPLVGLLGTVTGMISSFQTIEKIASPSPKDLAVGVYESLVNTTMGLFVAITFLVVYFIFKNKVTKLCLAINNICLDLIRRTAG